MRKYIIYLLIVLEIGGGFMGMWSLLVLPLWDTSTPAHVWIFSICAGFLFLLGIVAGLAFVDRPRLGAALSVVYQALQIPVVSSPLLSYKLLSGLQLGFGWLEGRPVFIFELGARCTFFLLRHTDPWLIGVNVLALALFVYLVCELRLMPKGFESSGE